MSPPPPHPDDAPPPPVTPSAGWEPVEAAPPVPPPPRDPLLDDPLFAELVEAKPLPDLAVEPVAPPPLPVAEPVEDIPTAEEVPLPEAVPVARPRPRVVAPPPPPPRRPEELAEAPRPRVFAACAVLGCFGLGFLGSLAFLAYAALTLLSGLPENRRGQPPAAAGSPPGPVGPTRYAGPKGVMTLPGTVDAVGRAAGGRYLLLRVPRTREVHVFDPNVGQLVQKFEIGSGGALFAGSATKLFVYNPDAATDALQRWDLATGTQEQAVPRPAGVARPQALVVGAGVDGPVYLVSVPVNGTASVRVFDPGTLVQVASHTVAGWNGSDRVRTHVRASDDGTVWGVTTADGAQVVRWPQPAGAPTLVRLAGRAGTSPVLATPSRDGKLVFTPTGVYDAAGGQRKAGRSLYTFPAAHGNGLFLSLDRDVVAGTLSDPVRVHPTTTPESAVELADDLAPRGLQSTDTGDLPPDQRVHFWPAAGLVVVVRSAAGGGGRADLQQLDVRRVDVPALLQGLPESYLLFGSEPQLWAVRGQEWRYRPVVWGADEKPGPVPEKVSGPAGMAVRNGEVVWTPGPGETRADVTIRVRSGDDLAEQRFRVAVLDEHDHDEDDDD